jgi:hypothetical protein
MQYWNTVISITAQHPETAMIILTVSILKISSCQTITKRRKRILSADGTGWASRPQVYFGNSATLVISSNVLWRTTEKERIT